MYIPKYRLTNNNKNYPIYTIYQMYLNYAGPRGVANVGQGSRKTEEKKNIIIMTAIL